MDDNLKLSNEEFKIACIRAWVIWGSRNKYIHNEPIPLTVLRCDWIMDYVKAFFGH